MTNEEISAMLTTINERLANDNTRIEKLERKQDIIQDLVVSVKLMESKQTSIESSLKELKDSVTELTMKPAKRWEDTVSQVISIIVAGIVAYFMAKVGL